MAPSRSLLRSFGELASAGLLRARIADFLASRERKNNDRYN